MSKDSKDDHGPDCHTRHVDCALRRIKELESTVVFLSSKLAKLAEQKIEPAPALASVICDNCGWSATWDPDSGPLVLSSCVNCDPPPEDEDDTPCEDVVDLAQLVEQLNHAVHAKQKQCPHSTNPPLNVLSIWSENEENSKP